jgi:TPR repeat protein
VNYVEILRVTLVRCPRPFGVDRSFRRLVLIVALLTGALAAAYAGEPKPDAAFNSLSAKFERWQVLAHQGNAEAQFEFGSLLLGLGSSPEVQIEGAKWLLNSAQQGYAPALNLMRNLAGAGNIGFEMMLGSMYSEGTAVLQDYAEAARWYRLCAERDNAACQIQLGVMYLRGQGLQQDYTQAHKWFNLAASGSFGEEVLARLPQTVQEGRKLAIQNRALAAANMNNDQIAEAQRLAREWRRQHSSSIPK